MDSIFSSVILRKETVRVMYACLLWASQLAVSVRKQKVRKRTSEWDLQHCPCCGNYTRRCWRCTHQWLDCPGCLP